MTSHIDEFTLLRHATGNLPEADQDHTSSHVTSCNRCSRALADFVELDVELRRLAESGGLNAESPPSDFDARDPFVRRPRPSSKRHPRPARVSVSELQDLSEVGLDRHQTLLKASGEPGGLEAALSALPLEETQARFSLLYALQETGRQIAQDPIRARKFAEAAIRRLRRERPDRNAQSISGSIVPWDVLWGQGHILAAQARIWTRDFRLAGGDLVVAYRAFARAGDETGLAVTELTESQRRFFIAEAPCALELAQRAQATFVERGLDDLAARALVAEAMAYFALDRLEDSVRAFRTSLPVFERFQLWSNYVGALNGLGTALQTMGQFDDARREYARALRRFSAENHRSWSGYLRHGLAGVLLAAGRHRQSALAAAGAANAFRATGLRASALVCSLLEIEAWARHGDPDRARHRLKVFLGDIETNDPLDESVLLEIESVLSGTDPDYERIAALRQRIESVFQEDLSASRQR